MSANLTKDEEVTEKILTLPNIITLVRFLLIPVFLWLLFYLHANGPALVVFALAACTDWVDGQVARRTHQVSKIGKMFDPFVDRFLLATGVISVCVLGRLPIWIVLLLITRDLVLVAEGQVMLGSVGKVPSVVYVGKVATALLLFGFCFLMLGLPEVVGLDIIESPWLPGFGSGNFLLGIWFVYAGAICSLIAFTVYQIKGFKMLRDYKTQMRN